MIEKPINGDLLSELISRHENSLRSSSGLISPTESDIRVKQVQDQENRMLQIARNFIELPRLAISTQAACQKTISLLREMTGYRRIFLYFLKKKAGESTPSWQLEMAFGSGKESLNQIQLTTQDGVGGHLISHGQILQLDSLAVEKDPKILSTFQDLRLDAIVPIVAENTLMGMVMMGGRLMGDPLNREELLLFYYLLENLGLYLKKPSTGPTQESTPRKSTQPSQEIESPKPEGVPSGESDGSLEIIQSSYEDMPTPYLLVGYDGIIRNANLAARNLFKLEKNSAGEMVADGLPSVILEKMGEVFEGSLDDQPVIVRKPLNESQLLRCRVFQINNKKTEHEKVVGVFVEEITMAPRSVEEPPEKVDPAPKVPAPEVKNEPVTIHEPESYDKRVYDKLARQIHYSLVPLSTHAQLLQQGHFDDNFQESLGDVLDAGILKFSRFSRQLSYMVRQKYDLVDKKNWMNLLESAFEESAEIYGDPKSSFEILEESKNYSILCEEIALKFAISEVFLNALQSNKGNPQFLVKISDQIEGSQSKEIEIVVRDMGDGFEERALGRAFEPFFSTKPAGLGLGLTVARKIVEGHGGTIIIRRTPAQNQHEVAIRLPIA